MKLKDLPSLEITGEKIQFFLKGEKVGETDLPYMTDMECRHELAKSIDIKEYDNFRLIYSDGNIKVDAKRITGLSVQDIDTDRGTYEGIMYSKYLLKSATKNTTTCPNCKHEFEIGTLYFTNNT